MRAFLPKLALAAVAALAISGTANAAVTISNYTAGQLTTPAGSFLIDNFDSGTVYTGFTFTGGATFSGTQPLVHQAPAGDLTNYIAVLGAAPAAVLTTPSNIGALSVFIGSLDNFNSISFYSGSHALVNTITGTQLRQFATGGSTTADVTDGRFFFNLAGNNVDEVDFGSTTNSLEIDNIAADVPEPGVWAMMMLGLGGLGYALRRRRFAVNGAATA